MVPEAFETPPNRRGRPQNIENENELEVAEHRLSAKDVARKVRSFEHFLYVWGSKAGYYMPPRSALTWHYVSQVLAGEKRLLRAEQVGHVQEFPKAKGVLVGDLCREHFRANDLHDYLPDVTERSQIPRTYFLNVGISRC